MEISEIKSIKILILLAFVYFLLNADHVFAQRKIVLGCSCPLSGPKSFFGKEVVSGMLSYFKYVKDKKLLNREIELKVLDDQYDPDITFKNTKDFLYNIKPIALISYVGTTNVVRILNLITKEKFPLIGPLTGTHQLRLPYRPYVFNVRNSFWAEAESLVDFAIKSLKKDKIGVIYENDDYGITGYKGVCRALAMKYNKNLVSEAVYEKNKKVSNRAITKLFRRKPNVIIMIGSAESLSDFIKRAKKRASNVTFMTLSSIGSFKFFKLIGRQGDNIFISQVVPPPTSNIKIAKEYKKLMKKYFPDKLLTFVGLEGFLNAKIVVEALRGIKNKPSHKSLIKALESFKKYDPGLGTKIDYGPFDREGSDLIFITEIRKGKFVLKKVIHKKISLYFF